MLWGCADPSPRTAWDPPRDPPRDMEAQLSFVRQLRGGVELRQQEAVAEAAATARQSVGEGTDTAAAGAGIAARAGTCCSKARSPAPSSFAPSEAPPSCPPSAQRPCDVRRRTPGGTGHGSAGQGDGYAEGSFGRVGSRSRCSPEPWRPTSGRTGAVLAWAGGHSDVHGSFGRGSPLLGARRGRAFWSQDSFVQGGDADGFI